MARVMKSWNSSNNGSALGFEVPLWPTDGELQFTLSDVLKVPPISQHGNVAEIISKCGGEGEVRTCARNNFRFVLVSSKI